MHTASQQVGIVKLAEADGFHSWSIVGTEIGHQGDGTFGKNAVPLVLIRDSENGAVIGKSVEWCIF